MLTGLKYLTYNNTAPLANCKKKKEKKENNNNIIKTKRNKLINLFFILISKFGINNTAKCKLYSHRFPFIIQHH